MEDGLRLGAPRLRYACRGNTACRPAFEQANLAAMPRDHAKLIHDIGEISALITAASDLDGLLQRIVDATAEHMHADVCSVYLYDETSQILVLRATHGLLSASVGNVWLHPGEGLTGLAFSEQRVLCEADAPSHPNYRYFPGIGEEAFRSFMAVPILRGRRPIGAMTLQSANVDHFTPEEAHVFRAIATQLATTIEMARLLLALEQPVTSAAPAPEPISSKLVQGRIGSEGIAVGECEQVRQPSLEELRALVADGGQGMPDFHRAVREAEEQLEHLERLANERLSDVTAAIFSAQLLMLRDQSWLRAMEANVAEGMHPAEAIYREVLAYVQRFDLIEDAYIREKRFDVLDVGRRLLSSLAHRREGETRFEGRIAIARELLPSEVLKLGLQKVAGFVLLSAGVTSHAAVLAHSLDLPLLIVDEPRVLHLHNGTHLILDGTQGNLVIEPAVEVERRFREQAELRRNAAHLGEQMHERTFTRDGTRVRLLANINLLADLEVARSYKAEGIGLYRTEFPFLIRNDLPSEEEQVRVYRRLVESMPGREITFRTLDVGGDKMLSYFDYSAEPNPFLGLRSIRFSLRHRDIFLEQVRAILRAAYDAEIHIMFPLISSPDELASAVEAVAECRSALASEGIPACSRVRLGMMVEVPSVLELVDDLAVHAEFFSIGTNDFIQYMLAVDRTNANVADMYLPHHPAVLRGLHRAVSAMLRCEREVTVCGDMAHDPRYVRFLLGIGVRRLSLAARYLPRIQECIARIDITEAEALAERLLGESTAAGTGRILDETCSCQTG